MARSKIFLQFYHRKTEPSEADIELFAGIVKKAADIFNNRYGGTFITLLWDNTSPLSDKIFSALDEKPIRVIKMSEILPNYFEDRDKYKIHPEQEGHPNAFAHEQIADYLNKLLASVLTIKD